MKAGRELNKMIHEKVFEHDLTDFEWPKGYMSGTSMVKESDQGVTWIDIPPYSETWDGMSLVVEKMKEKHRFHLETIETLQHGVAYAVGFDVNKPTDCIFRESAPLATCIAALKAVGWEDEEK